MRRGLVFTLLNMHFLMLLLTIYVAFVGIEQMPAYRSYLPTRVSAAYYWWHSEFNGYPLTDFTPSGGCIEIPQIRPYNEDLPDGTKYDDLNEITPIQIKRWCS